MAIHVKGGRNVVQPLAVEETSPSVSAHHPFTLPAGSHRAGIPEVSRTRLLPLEGGGRRAMSCVAVTLLAGSTKHDPAAQLILGAARWG